MSIGLVKIRLEMLAHHARNLPGVIKLETGFIKAVLREIHPLGVLK